MEPFTANPFSTSTSYSQINDKPKEKEKEKPSSQPNETAPNLTTAAPTSTGNAPYAEGEKLRESLVSSHVHQLTAAKPLETNKKTTAAESATSGTATAASASSIKAENTKTQNIPTHIQKKINVFNSIMEHGILTPARAEKLGFASVNSADHNHVKTRVCLNYIYSDSGRNSSLISPARGGLPVVLERTKDKLGEPKSLEGLRELSERAHSSMLFILPVTKKQEDADSAITIKNEKGEDEESMIMLPSRNKTGSAEVWATASVSSTSIGIAILPKQLEPYQSQLKNGDTILVFVGSKELDVPYNATKTIVTINCPDYSRALMEISEDEIFTHMVRTPTSRELEEDEKAKSSTTAAATVSTSTSHVTMGASGNTAASVSTTGSATAAPSDDEGLHL